MFTRALSQHYQIIKAKLLQHSLTRRLNLDIAADEYPGKARIKATQLVRVKYLLSNNEAEHPYLLGVHVVDKELGRDPHILAVWPRRIVEDGLQALCNLLMVLVGI